MNFNATLIGQSITFLVFVWFCMKYVWPPLMAALAQRNAKISDGLAAAEQGQKALEQAQVTVAEDLNEAKRQAQEIIKQAQKRATEIVDDAKTTAHGEAEKIKQSALAEIDQQVSHAREQLRKEVSVIALRGAEQVLGREVDGELHATMLNDLVAQV